MCASASRKVEPLGLGRGLGRGDPLAHAHRHARVDAPRHHRLDRARRRGARRRRTRRPARSRPTSTTRPRLSNAAPAGAYWPAAEIVDRRRVGVDVAEARAALDRHVADGEALLHRHAIDDGARVLVRVAHAALHAELVDDREDHVLRVDAPGERAVHAHLAQLGLGHRRGTASRSTSRTCVVPMPKAMAPTAPWVEVWLSPHAIVMPGWLRPSSGPITWTMPCLPVDMSKSGRLKSFMLRYHVHRHLLRQRIGVGAGLIGRRDDVVERAEGALGHPHLQLRVASASGRPAASSPRGSGAGRSGAGSGRTAASGPCARPTPCRAACVAMRAPPLSSTGGRMLPQRQLCSPVKRSVANGKLQLHDRRRALSRARDAAGRGAHGLGGRGGAPAAHHLVGGEPADPAGSRPISASSSSSAPAAACASPPPARRRCRWCASSGAAPSRPSASSRSWPGARPPRCALAASDYLGKGLLAPVLPRPARRRSAGALRDRHHALARAACAWSPSGDVDLAVVTGQETPRGLEDRHLFDQPFVWVGPRRGRDRAPLTERLRREPVLRLGSREPRPRAARPVSRRRAHPARVDHRRAERLAAAVVRLGRARHRARCRRSRWRRRPRTASSARPRGCRRCPWRWLWRASARRQPALARLARAPGHGRRSRGRAPRPAARLTAPLRRARTLGVCC